MVHEISNKENSASCMNSMRIGLSANKKVYSEKNKKIVEEEQEQEQEQVKAMEQGTELMEFSDEQQQQQQQQQQEMDENENESKAEKETRIGNAEGFQNNMEKENEEIEDEKKSKSASQFSELLEDVMRQYDEAEADKMRTGEDVAVDHDDEDDDEEKEEAVPFAQNIDLKEICLQMQSVANENVLHQVDQEALVSFLKLINQAMIDSGNAENHVSELDYAVTLLTAMKTEKVDQRVLSHEILENILSSCKTLLQENVLPLMDQYYLTKLRGSTLSSSSSASKTKSKVLKGKSTKAKRTKKKQKKKKKKKMKVMKSRKRASTSRKRKRSDEFSDEDDDNEDHDDGDYDYEVENSDEEDDEDDDDEEEEYNLSNDENYLSSDSDDSDEDNEGDENVNRKGKRQKRKNKTGIVNIMPRLYKVIVLVDETVWKMTKIQDELVLPLAGMCISTLYFEPTKHTSLNEQGFALQQACMDLLRNLFKRNQENQTFILDEIVDCITKLPKTNKFLRTFTTQGSDIKIQATSAIILQLTQCVCQAQSTGLPSIQASMVVAKNFLSKLLERCASPAEHADEEDTKCFRVFLDHFVEDLLLLLHTPEWPSAELVLKMLSGFLANHLLKQNTKASKNAKIDSQTQRFGVQALTLLGQLLARIQNDILWANQSRLSLPEKRPHAENNLFNTVCPICDTEVDESGKDDQGEGQEEEGSSMKGTKKQNKTLELNNPECTSCGSHFHKACLNQVVEQKTFCCDNCMMLAQLENVNFDYRYKLNSEQRQSEDYKDLDAFRQLHLNYVATQAANGSMAAKFSYEFCIAQWAHADQVASFHPSKDVLIQQWGRRQQETEKRAKYEISPFVARAIVKHLSATSPAGLCTEEASQTMLSRLLCILGTGLASFRARSIKALAHVVAANPDLMTNETVEKAMKDRILDEAISVREAALELVGKYVLAKPELVHLYEQTLLNRLNDIGLSVRKRVVKILREILLRHRTGYNRTRIHAELLGRVVDPQEEDSVKDLIIGIFRDLWFKEPSASVSTTSSHANGKLTHSFSSPIPTLRRADSTPSMLQRSPSMPLDDTAFRTPGKMTPVRKTLVTPMQAMRFQNTNTPIARQLSMHELTATPGKPLVRTEQIEMNAKDIVSLVEIMEDFEWLEELLRLVLGDSKDPTVASNAKARAKNKLMCASIVEALINELILLQDEDAELTTLKDGKLVARDIEKSTFQTICTLQLFCKADPQLLVPHLQTLSPYTSKGMLLVHSEDRVQAICMLVEMFALILEQPRLWEKPLIIQIAKDLQNLIYKDIPQVMISAIACLGVVSRQIEKNDQLLSGILNRFCSFLESIKLKKTMNGERPHIVSNAQRAVLACGALTLAMIEPTEEITEVVLQFVLSHAADPEHKSTRMNAMRSLGLLLQKNQKLMLREGVDLQIAQGLKGDNDSIVIAQTLTSLSDLLCLGEKRIERGQAQKDLENRTSVAVRVMGDQDQDSGILAALMQKHSKAIIGLLFHKTAKVRVNSVILVGTMLRQGLVNPLQCIEPMVTLESDEKLLVHNTAHQFLVELDERHPEFLLSRVIQGIIRSFYYRGKVVGVQDVTAQPISATVPTRGEGDHFTIGPLQPTFSLFSRLYRSCFASKHASRSRFLQAAIALFQPDPAIFFKGDEKLLEHDQDEIEMEDKEDETETNQAETSNPRTSSSSSSSSSISLENKLTLAEQESTMEFSKTDHPLSVLHYVAETLATLPYTVVEEPLWIIYLINRATSLHGESLQEILSSSLEAKSDSDDAHKVKVDQKLHLAAKAAQQLIMLLHLKVFLKKVYNLTDARCQKFNPNESSKTNDKAINNPPANLPYFSPPDLATIKLFENGSLQKHSVPQYQRCLKKFKILLEEDPDDVDAHVNIQVGKKGKKRRRKSKSRQEVEDDEDNGEEKEKEKEKEAQQDDDNDAVVVGQDEKSQAKEKGRARKIKKKLSSTKPKKRARYEDDEDYSE